MLPPVWQLLQTTPLLLLACGLFLSGGGCP